MQQTRPNFINAEGCINFDGITQKYLEDRTQSTNKQISSRFIRPISIYFILKAIRGWSRHSIASQG